MPARARLGHAVCASAVPLATGERMYSRWDIRDLPDSAVAVVQPDISHAGGTFESRGSRSRPRYTGQRGATLSTGADRARREPADRLLRPNFLCCRGSRRGCHLAHPRYRRDRAGPARPHRHCLPDRVTGVAGVDQAGDDRRPATWVRRCRRSCPPDRRRGGACRTPPGCRVRRRRTAARRAPRDAGTRTRPKAV
jgi:hypothetical protein